MMPSKLHSIVASWLDNLHQALAEPVKKMLRQVNSIEQLAFIRDECFTLLQVRNICSKSLVETAAGF